ncbi:MAG: 30S ribosomal protein S15 [Candidatus Micrarchaeota archaeon]
MARLHSKKGGRSGTKRPKRKTSPEWVSENEHQVKEIILKLAKEGTPKSKIGRILRDEYAIPNARPVIGETIGSYLKKENANPEYPDDVMDLIRRAVGMRKHMKEFKKDIHNKVKLLHIESKINRLVKYYKRKGVLAKDWKYNPESAALLVK